MNDDVRAAVRAYLKEALSVQVVVRKDLHDWLKVEVSISLDSEEIATDSDSVYIGE